ncbi:hypothetical protein [Streptomyces sp. Tue6028]|uniref:hypothetical protein n=1 Tax=Streptomyces sp. Tue6028 TaxID=2036037 RepID=UPI00117DAE68|nr:hypothetical protein [Streptomyces sp. Tue6028]
MRRPPGLPPRDTPVGRSARAALRAPAGTAIRCGGDQLASRIVSQRDAAWIGAQFGAVDAKQ